jgi:hypothetical protein
MRVRVSPRALFKKMPEIKFAPKEIFDQILEWAVVPTFDLVIQYGTQGVIVVKRKIAPYKDQWALPGLRMYKGESIDDTLIRIAKKELGLNIDPSKKIFLGQYVGKFKTEHNRQDLSTGYLIKINSSVTIEINPDHFYSYAIVKKLPQKIGAMYRSYLKQYFRKKF